MKSFANFAKFCQILPNFSSLALTCTFSGVVFDGGHYWSALRGAVHWAPPPAGAYCCSKRKKREKKGEKKKERKKRREKKRGIEEKGLKVYHLFLVFLNHVKDHLAYSVGKGIFPVCR